MDEGLLQECPPPASIPVAADGSIAMGELLLADLELSGQYEECRALHQGLIEAVRAAR